MLKRKRSIDTREIFETMSVPRALSKMAIPTIVSNLITLVYNIADTWYIARTGNPYMVAASSLVLSVFMMTIVISNLFGAGGGTLVVRLLGAKQEDEAKKVASLSVVMAGGSALLFSVLVGVFMTPLLNVLGASANTAEFARQYLFFVLVIGGVPTVLSSTMSSIVRNIGFSKQAAFGLGLGGVLNVLLDPLFMFVLLPQGYEVMGAALATMLSNVCALIYYLIIYRRLSHESILYIPRRVERIRKQSMKSLFSVGIPAAAGVLLFDITNIILNRLTAGHGDLELAAIGIVLKVERLPLNIGIGIALGMMPLVAYNYASGNFKRMKQFFFAAMAAGLSVAFVSVFLYRFGAEWIMRLFIDEPETFRYGVSFLKARCVATPFMFMSFHAVHYMQAIGRGQASFWMAFIRQIVLNIPMLYLLNHFFKMMGIVWTQACADVLNVIASYLICYVVSKTLFKQKEEVI